MNIQHLRLHVVRPTLQHLELWSAAAENLVLGTALVESKGEYLLQLGGGPALGLWQIEPDTHDDVWANYLAYHHELRVLMHELETKADITAGAKECVGNLYYAAGMCRLIYRRSPKPLPDHEDVQGMAELWKHVYNTELGLGSVEDALPYFSKACFTT